MCLLCWSRQLPPDEMTFFFLSSLLGTFCPQQIPPALCSATTPHPGQAAPVCVAKDPAGRISHSAAGFSPSPTEFWSRLLSWTFGVVFPFSQHCQPGMLHCALVLPVPVPASSHLPKLTGSLPRLTQLTCDCRDFVLVTLSVLLMQGAVSVAQRVY